MTTDKQKAKTASGQKFIARNRAPRVQIEYDVETYGSERKVQLPFVMGVLSDLAGKRAEPLPDLAERKFLEIDIDNFDERMKSVAPRVAFQVPNTLTGEGLLNVDMTFDGNVVTLHPRVTEETRGLIGKDTIALMKPGVILINTARGPLVDYDALYEALVSGQIASAMLETFAVEPVPSDWPLLLLPNVTLTPHIAGASVRTVTYAAEKAAEEVRRYLAGLPPVNPC